MNITSTLEYITVNYSSRWRFGNGSSTVLKPWVELILTSTCFIDCLK